MQQQNLTAIYSMIGIVAVFLVVVMALPTSITGEMSLRELFRGELTVVGECTTAKDTCPKEGFCSAKLAVSENSKLKGVYRGDCITKYKPGHLCKKDYQCRSNECAGLSNVVASKFLSLQIGACI